MASNHPTPDRRADVELRLPADGAYASVLRTTTAGLAARLDFPIDDIEDLRMAVGEATAMVLGDAVAGSDVVGRFYQRSGELTVSLTAQVSGPTKLDYDSFAWQVLTTLASEAAASSTDDELTISLTMVSSHQEPGR
ncbi:anti-sigma factor [Nocardioides sp. MAH-18]|uniref:Anti-sigma factor n=1 Tax=Nocardioides agri TaxID=2682843 RepID=A0A6L6XKR9_9ACTN|nr:MULTISPECIES: anti-sigma factor [unclassified Nocardioides]MBA2956641.1 anti-sigma factor [Nocardioides sp. CGMCC 1.13656]MVQ47784.1 anti-sigma factor [Nocardioides sp. MAH-18]